MIFTDGDFSAFWGTFLLACTLPFNMRLNVPCHNIDLLFLIHNIDLLFLILYTTSFQAAITCL